MLKQKAFKIIVIFVLVFLGISGFPLAKTVAGAGTPAFVQQASCKSGGFSCAITIAPTAGDALVVFVSENTNATLAVSDSKSDSYVVANSFYGPNAGFDAQESFLANNVAGGVTTITCTDSNDTTNLACTAIELSGGQLTVDQTAVGNNSSATTNLITAGSGVTASATEVVIVCASNYYFSFSSFTAAAPWTVTSSAGASGLMGCEYQTTSTTGSFAGSLTAATAQHYVMQLVTLSSSGSGSGDVTPPTLNISSPANNATVSGSITVTGTASDNMAVSSVSVSIDGGTYSNASGTSNWSYSLNTTSLTNASHTITVKAADSSGNASTEQISVIVNNSASDTQAPTTPTNLSATAVSSSGINLAWTAATDNVGVTGYKIYRNSTQIATSNTDSYSDTGLSASTQYTYTVSAYDAAGNNSSQSSSAVATTQASQTVTGNNIYITKTATGSANGADCSDALPVSFFNTSSNWAATQTSGKISPGTTVHLCGTITSQMTGQGSGSAGNPITILFDPGAKISVPVCAGNGCMIFNGLSYIVVDGGSTVSCGYVNQTDTPCNNGIIENTANGTGLANQSPSQAIYASPCNHCEFKNLMIRNLYVHNSTADSVVDQTEVRCITVTGSNTTVHNNTMHDAGWCLIDSYAQGDSNVAFYNNEAYNIDHGYVLSGGTYSGSSGPFYFYNNHIHGFSNWDTTTNDYHHDGIHCFSSNVSGNTINSIYIYNNLFGGPTGNNMNSFIYMEGGTTGPACASQTSDMYLFNNVMAISGYSTAGHMGLFSGRPTVYNNTLISTDSNSSGTCITNSGSYGGIGPATSKNNAVGGCFILYSYSPGSWISGSPDYNVYGYINSSTDFYCSGQVSFAGWKGCAGNEAHSTTQASINVNTSTGMPNAGSPLLNAGINLYSVCNGQANPGLGALCYDAAGTARPNSGVWDAGAYQYYSGASDTTPPSTPTGLTATAVSSSAINLNWTASTDNVGVTGYKIFRGGVQVATSATNVYSDTGLAASTQYTYSISAYDAAGNNSAQSTNANATTQSGTIGSGSNVYIAQTSAGAGNGSDCADALAYTFFNASSNWASTATSGKIYPGITVHLCGTFTAPAGSSGYLTFQGSGSSGNPITLLFESGAVLQAPYWGANGAIFSSNNYNVVDGGSNGLITATANGTNLANHVDGNPGASNGVFFNNANNGEIKNLTVTNIYVHSVNLADTADGTYNWCIHWQFGSHIVIDNNTVHDCGVGIRYDYAAGTTSSDISVFNNTVFNINWGVIIGDGGASSVLNGPVIIHNNKIHDFLLWDQSNNFNHHDGIYCFATNSGSILNACDIYNNFLSGDPGQYMNAWIFVSDLPHTCGGFHIFNNLVVNSALNTTDTPANGFVQDWCNGDFIYNNTFVGSTQTSTNSVNNSNPGININPGTNVTLKNNIISMVRNCLGFANGDPTALLASDNNIYWNCDVGWDGLNNAYSTVSAWQGCHSNGCPSGSHDLNSLKSNPDLSSYVPQAGSPAVSAGANLTSLGITALDLDAAGITRPSSGAWDIGAYQYASAGSSGTPIPGDINLDHIVNSLDYSIMNSHWFQNYAAADLNNDSIVNSLDFAILKSNWGKTW